MRLAWLLLMVVGAAQAGVVSRDWRGGKLKLQLNDGTAEMEWISSVAFRFARSWEGAPAAALSPIAHDPVQPTFEESGSTIIMRTKYITAELDRSDLKLRVKSGDTAVTNMELAKTDHGAEMQLTMSPEEKVFGLMGGETGHLNSRGETLFRRDGLFFTSAGYGIFVPGPADCFFNTLSGRIAAQGRRSFEYAFYYGPTPKEILEQHRALTPKGEVTGNSLALLGAARVLPKEATPLPTNAINSWESLSALVTTLNQWSLSAVLYPALDLAVFDKAPNEVKQRAKDLSTLLPIVYRSSGEGGIDREIRNAWEPYLITYLREAHDRGIPLIRPLAMEFAKDAATDQQADVFMLGDEVLLAPVVGPGIRQHVQLPRGIWTDLRTNIEYRGNQVVEVDAPLGRVPTFARNGWIVPLARQEKMELHYFPSLAAEFFLWEPDKGEYSQFHAAPAGDFVRVEIESKAARTYEWVIHHMQTAREVSEESAMYQGVNDRALLRPGTWWHDAANNDLHVMMRAEARSDRIVNISF
jgi:glycosyl hydrolase family 31